TGQPGSVALAVGEKREVTIKIDRHGYQEPVTVRWSGPKEVRVSPAGPLTLKPGDPDPVLTVRLMAEPSGEDPRLEITVTPVKETPGDTASARVALRATPGPCARLIEVGERSDGNVEAVAFTPDGSLALLGGGPDRKEERKDKEKTPSGAGEERFAIRVWDLSRGEAVGSLSGHTGRVTGLAVSAD